MKNLLAFTMMLASTLAGCSKKSADPAPASGDNAKPGGASEAAKPGDDDHARGGDWGARRKQREADLDTNHDGVVSDEERAAGRRKRAEELRTKLDADHDGKLTPDELKAATGRMRFDDPAAVDTNHDGNITVDELDAALKARAERMRADHHGDDSPPAQ